MQAPLEQKHQVNKLSEGWTNNCNVQQDFDWTAVEGKTLHTGVNIYMLLLRMVIAYNL